MILESVEVIYNPWGIGLHLSDANAMDPDKWTGANQMGKTLEKVRENIRTKDMIDRQLAKMKDDAMEKEDDIHAIVLGDSNCREVIVEEVPFKLEVKSVGGTGLSDVEAMLNDTVTPLEKVSVVLLHVGTCDFDVCVDNDVDMLYSEYVETVAVITEKIPGVNIVISSVPPRAPRPQRPQQARLNHEIAALNDRLRTLAVSEMHISFIDNDDGLLANGVPDDLLYRKSDKSGVHLNTLGANILADKFSEELREVYYKMKLENEYDVIPDTIPK